MKTRSLLETLGFQEDWEAITDEPPAYAYDFGNMRLGATQVLGRSFHAVFLLTGHQVDRRSIVQIQSELGLEVDSFEEGVALIAYAIGKDFIPARPTAWLDDGRAWSAHLPWERKRAAYEGRPRCLVDKEWFRLAAKTLRAIASVAGDDDQAVMTFDGEVLRIAACGQTIVVAASGTAWDDPVSIPARRLDHLPVRLGHTVGVSVWEGRLTIGNRLWTLAQPEGQGDGPA